MTPRDHEMALRSSLPPVEEQPKKPKHKVKWAVICLTGTVIMVLSPLPFLWQSMTRSKKYNNLPSVGMDDAVAYSIDSFTAMNNQSSTLSLQDFDFTLLQRRLENDKMRLGDADVERDSGLSWQQVESWTGASSASSTTVCQVFCRFPQSSPFLDHFPHFVQDAYPCWSLFQRFEAVHVQHFFMVLPSNRPDRRQGSAYIRQFIKAMQRSSLNITILYHNETFPYDDCSLDKDGDFDVAVSTPTPVVSIVAVKNFQDSGYDHPVRYFMNERSDLAELQKAVLGSRCKAVAAQSNGSTNRRRDRPVWFKNQAVDVLILDRQGSTRDWALARHMKKRLEKEFGRAVKVRYIANFKRWSLYKQAEAMHWADVILSPHGAQLSNLAYIRPCTVVIELFPPHFYLQFFQSLVVAAHGLSFEAYPAATNQSTHRFDDAHTIATNRSRRSSTRSLRVLTSPNSIVEGWSDLLLAREKCQQGLS